MAGMGPEEIIREIQNMKIISAYMALMLASTACYALENWEGYCDHIQSDHTSHRPVREIQPEVLAILREELHMYVHAVGLSEKLNDNREAGKEGKN